MKKNNKNIIFLTQYFYPEINSTAQLLYELAEDLIKKEMDISVYAKYPPSSYEDIKKSEVYNGIKIDRIKTTTFPKSNFMGRSMNYIIFFLKLSLKLLFSRNRAPLLVLSSPPFLPLLAFLLKKLKGQKYIYLVHDLYPDIAVQLGFLKKDGFIARLWEKFNKSLCRNAEKIIVLDEKMKGKVDKYVEAKGKKKLVIIPNWADGNFLRPIEKKSNRFVEENKLQNKFIILYSGNFGLTHNLEMVLETAEKLKESRAFFLLIGEGAKKDKLIKMKDAKKLNNVMILPFQPREVLPYSFSSADVSLVLLDKGFGGLSVPSKLYSILASGRPILAALEGGGAVESVIKEADCGVLLSPDNHSGIEQAVVDLMNDPERIAEMGKNARRYFERNFDRKIVTSKYYEVLSNLS